MFQTLEKHILKALVEDLIRLITIVKLLLNEKIGLMESVRTP